MSIFSIFTFRVIINKYLYLYYNEIKCVCNNIHGQIIDIATIANFIIKYFLIIRHITTTFFFYKRTLLLVFKDRYKEFP